MDTIFALASAHGKAGVAVVRVSGELADEAVERLCGDLPDLRRASVRSVRNASGDVLDEALVVRFPKGGSFTGEKVAELHLHGSPAVVSVVLDELGGMDGLRHAEPGEFTRRALENERLDIAQVEGLADLIESETEAQRRQSMRVFSGALRVTVESWRERLIRAAALIEATIDFADEDVPVDVTPEVSALLESVQDELISEVAGSKIAERIQSGFEVAIVGSPNAGKSTLLNRLAGREAAITSEVAGTTRDVIEVRMDLKGLPVTVLDTAGLRDSTDAVENLGIERARSRAEMADLRVFLVSFVGEDLGLPMAEDDVTVLGKSDTGNGGDLSGLSGEGVDELVDRIASVLENRAKGVGVATRSRHLASMKEALDSIVCACSILSDGRGDEVAAENLRRGILALESVVGRVGVEDLLDEIFSRFCLGK